MPTSTFPFEIKGTKPDRDWIDELLNRVGLEGFGGRFPRELSGGMQQRAALVRALSYKPSVLLMDEPFGALDAFTREEMNRLVEEIWLDTPTTIVLITHSIDEAIFLSDRVIVMSPRPGRVANVYDVPFPRPRSFEIMATREVFDLTNAIKLDIVGDAEEPLPAGRRRRRRSRRNEDSMNDTDAIPEFKASPAARAKSASPTCRPLPRAPASSRCARCWPSSSSRWSSSAAPSWRCSVFEVPQYILPTPSAIARRCSPTFRSSCRTSATRWSSCSPASPSARRSA